MYITSIDTCILSRPQPLFVVAFELFPHAGKWGPSPPRPLPLASGARWRPPRRDSWHIARAAARSNSQPRADQPTKWPMSFCLAREMVQCELAASTFHTNLALIHAGRFGVCAASSQWTFQRFPVPRASCALCSFQFPSFPSFPSFGFGGMRLHDVRCTMYDVRKGSGGLRIDVLCA